MGFYDRDPERPSPPIRDEQRLAAAILRQAIVDATAPLGVLPIDRADAIAFLEDSDRSLSWWAHVAGLDAEAVRRLVQQALQAGRRRHQRVGQPRIIRPEPRVRKGA